MKIYLVRHTESKAQTEEEYSLDANLSDFGVSQAKMLQSILPQISFDHILLSPLKRARQTFEHSGVAKSNVIFDSRLIEELPAGMYADNILPYEETPHYGTSDSHNAWEVPVLNRVKLFLNDLKDFDHTSTVLVVCHAGVLNHLLQCFLNPEYGTQHIPSISKCVMDNGAVSIIEINKVTPNRLVAWNNTAYIE